MTKPRASRQTIVSFPIRRERSSTAATVSSEVSAARTISTSLMSGGGLNQCIPATRSGRDVAAASSAIESSDVLERRRACAGAAPSSSRKTSRLSARSSGTASMTASASRTASAISVVVAIRESAAAASSSVSVPAFTSRARLFPIETIAFSRTPAETSARRTRNPEVAATWAMPLPIAPAPTTAIVSSRISFMLERDRRRTACSPRARRDSP